MIDLLLFELKTKIEHLYITGIRGSKNNSYLLKNIHIIEKHVDEAEPAYATLVYALKQVVDPAVSNDLAFFADIQASLNYLLRLHGAPIAAGEERSEHTPTSEIDNVVTVQSYLELKPLIVALSNIGEDKLDVIRKARKNRLFDDFRTYPYLNIALDYEQIATEVEDIIKRDIGKKMIPFLLNGLRNSDKPGDVRRSALLRKFQYKKQ